MVNHKAHGVQKVEITGNPIFVVAKMMKQSETCKIEKKSHGTIYG